MKGLDVAARLPYVDSTRMGAAGASYGGYMIYWIAGHTGRFKTLGSHDGGFNPTSMAGAAGKVWVIGWGIGGTPHPNPAPSGKRSPPHFSPKRWTTIPIPDQQLSLC